MYYNMTIDSFNNYKSNLLYLHSEKGYELSNLLSTGNCKFEDERLVFNMATIFMCTIVGYDIEGDNYVSTDTMKGLTTSLNKIYGTNYNVDYIIN